MAVEMTRRGNGGKARENASASALVEMPGLLDQVDTLHSLLDQVDNHASFWVIQTSQDGAAKNRDVRDVRPPWSRQKSLAASHAAEPDGAPPQPPPSPAPPPPQTPRRMLSPPRARPVSRAGSTAPRRADASLHVVGPEGQEGQANRMHLTPLSAPVRRRPETATASFTRIASPTEHRKAAEHNPRVATGNSGNPAVTASLEAAASLAPKWETAPAGERPPPPDSFRSFQMDRSPSAGSLSSLLQQKRAALNRAPSSPVLSWHGSRPATSLAERRAAAKAERVGLLGGVGQRRIAAAAGSAMASASVWASYGVSANANATAGDAALEAVPRAHDAEAWLSRMLERGGGEALDSASEAALFRRLGVSRDELGDIDDLLQGLELPGLESEGMTQADACAAGAAGATLRSPNPLSPGGRARQQLLRAADGLARAGLDRAALASLGVGSEVQTSRLYRQLFVYSFGVHHAVLALSRDAKPGARGEVTLRFWCAPSIPQSIYLPTARDSPPSRCLSGRRRFARSVAPARRAAARCPCAVYPAGLNGVRPHDAGARWSGWPRRR